jgi:SNF family Na+-dependent transporter
VVSWTASEAAGPEVCLVLYVLLAVAVVGALLAMLPFVVGRDRRLDEVARFHRARQMTTSWSVAGVTRPPLAEEALRDSEDASEG